MRLVFDMSATVNVAGYIFTDARNSSVFMSIPLTLLVFLFCPRYSILANLYCLYFVLIQFDQQKKYSGFIAFSSPGGYNFWCSYEYLLLRVINFWWVFDTVALWLQGPLNWDQICLVPNFACFLEIYHKCFYLMFAFAQWHLVMLIMLQTLFPSCSYQCRNVEFKQEDIPATNEENQCAVCLDKKACIVFVPCGHKKTCQQCCLKIGNNCIYCRALITDKVKVYD